MQATHGVVHVPILRHYVKKNARVPSMPSTGEHSALNVVRSEAIALSHSAWLLVGAVSNRETKTVGQKTPLKALSAFLDV